MSCIAKLQLHLKLRKSTLTFSVVASYFSAPCLLSHCEFNKLYVFARLPKIVFFLE